MKNGKISSTTWLSITRNVAAGFAIGKFPTSRTSARVAGVPVYLSLRITEKYIWRPWARFWAPGRQPGVGGARRRSLGLRSLGPCRDSVVSVRLLLILV